jgi:plastocyanin
MRQSRLPGARLATKVLLTALCLCSGVTLAYASTAQRKTAQQQPNQHACSHRHHKRCAATQRHKHSAHLRARRSSPTTQSANPSPSPPPSPSASPSPLGTTLNPVQPAPTAPAPEAPATPAPSAGPAHVQVSAKEFSFTLSHASVAAGHIDIELLNAGQDEHNLHIRPASGGADVGALPTLQAGHHEDIEFNLPAGTYTFYCSMPSHEALGMKATFTVQ